MVLERPCLIMFFSLKFDVALDTSAIVRALPSCHDPAALEICQVSTRSDFVIRKFNACLVPILSHDRIPRDWSHDRIPRDWYDYMNLLLLKKRGKRKHDCTDT